MIQVSDPVKGSKRKLTVQATNAWFNDELDWITVEIAKAKSMNEKVVILTHHSPIMDGSAPQYRGNEIDCAFCTDLEYLLGPPVTLWCYGHTHYVQDIMRKGTRIVSNCCGYPMESGKSNWNPLLVLEI